MNENKQLIAALVAAQAKMPKVAFDSANPFLHNRYASLGAIIETSRPVLAEHGLAVTQWPVVEGGAIGVRTMLVHSSGETMDGTIMLPIGEEKGKSLAQVAGSIISYLRRYSWQSILGMYADEDTDGNAPQSHQERPAHRPQSTHQPPQQNSTEWLPSANSGEKPTETPEQRKKRWIEACTRAGGGSPDYAAQMYEKLGVLLPNEDLSDLPVEKVPKTRIEADRLLAEIRGFAGIPTAPPATSAVDETKQKVGFIKVVTQKPTKTGNDRFGILLIQNEEDKGAGEWFNTFSSTTGKQAIENKGKLVSIKYTVGEYGNDIIEGGLGVVI